MRLTRRKNPRTNSLLDLRPASTTARLLFRAPHSATPSRRRRRKGKGGGAKRTSPETKNRYVFDSVTPALSNPRKQMRVAIMQTTLAYERTGEREGFGR